MVMSIKKGSILLISLYSYIKSKSHSWLLRFRNESPRVLKKVIGLTTHTEMESTAINLPENLHGSKVLDKEAFNMSLNLLSLHVEEKKISKLKKPLKKYLLQMRNLKQVQDINENYKRMLFNPKLVTKMSEFDDSAQKLFQDLNISEKNFVNSTINLTYENFNYLTILKAVLPKDECILNSFSKIGHIIHLNLKPHLLDYKYIIGQVLLDKISGTRTVVNKINRTISVYRNVEIELLCGDDDYIVKVKENGITYELDYSKVYWNPRLSTEHFRVVHSLNYTDILFDVFCGVGPFAIPAAKRFCEVYANDLNPDSMHWLKRNIQLNKISNNIIHTFNKDGSDFIYNDLKEKLIQLYKNELFEGKIVIVMNLPASALKFLKCFKGLIKSEINELNVEKVRSCLPLVLCYFFAQSDDDLKSIIKEETDIDLNKVEHSICDVRSVAASKVMFRLDLKLPLDYMIFDSSDSENLNVKTVESSLDEPKAKKKCLRINYFTK